MLEQRSIPKTLALYLIAILFVILNLSNIKVAGVSSLTPLFDLMMIFYFGVFRNVFPIWFIFLLGIWNDSLNGNPLGTTALCYIIIVKFFILLNSKMMIRENFKQVWKQFVFFCFAFLFIKWSILSIFNGAAYGMMTPLVQFVLSIVFYVLMHRVFDYLNTKLLEG